MSTEKELREKMIEAAKYYLGAKTKSAKHKKIIDTFNKVKPDGAPMTYTAPWCAAFVSGLAIEVFGVTKAKKYFPLSYNCGTIITKAKKLGIWIENDAYTPSIGDWVLYDWDDSGKGDNTGGADHVGIVEKVTKTVITVIEGNKGSAATCARREIKVNGRYIRGFVTPKYSAMADTKTSEKKQNEKKKSVDEIAKEVIAGKWGNGSDRKTALTKAGYDYDAVQKKVNELLSTKKKYKVVYKYGMNVRKSATTNSAIVGGLEYGQVFTSSKQSNGWAYCDNRKGWVKIANNFIKEV